MDRHTEDAILTFMGSIDTRLQDLSKQMGELTKSVVTKENCADCRAGQQKNYVDKRYFAGGLFVTSLTVALVIFVSQVLGAAQAVAKVVSP